MSNILTKEMVKEKIDYAETKLTQCFDMLLDIKHARENFADAIMNFQITLAECLYDLMQFYHLLQNEKKTIISQKSKIEEHEFLKLIKTNAKFINIVSSTIKIGKTLGDAFVWFFYHRNRPELDMHFEHPSTGLFTSGIGGKGEIEFIRNNLNLDGLFVIYHGITDMLRVGDFSLYANGIGIVGIGELKTKQENGHLKVSASITSKVEVPKPQGAIDDGLSFKDRVELLKKDFPKLTEQIAVQDKLMKAKDSELSSQQYASYEYNLINSLTTSNPITINEDNSLLLLGAWSKYSSLFDILYYDETSNTPDSFKTHALKLMEPESPYNECIISEIDLQMHFPRLPILWWKIEDDICKDIYFKKLIVSTVLNPAKLIQHFVDEGFTVSSLGPTKDIKLEREIDGKHLELGSLEAYFDLIQQSLMKTENVFSLVKSVINDCDKGKIIPGSKIEMHIRQDNFGGTLKQ